MKKIISTLSILIITTTLFAASFKKGITIYVSKSGDITNSSKSIKSEKVISTATKGDFGKVIESNNKRTKILFSGSGIEGWVDNKNLTKKKIVKEIVTTNLDNYALSGKGNIQKDTSDILEQEENTINILSTGDAK